MDVCLSGPKLRPRGRISREQDEKSMDGCFK